MAASSRHEARRSCAGLWGLVAMMWLAGCATGAAGGRYTSFQDTRGPVVGAARGGGGLGFWQEGDDFQRLQRSAGLEADSWHETGEELKPRDARELWEALVRTGTSLQSFGPRRSLAFLLRQVLTRNETVSYAELLQRLRPFGFLVVMRPDGYLVSAFTGRPLQRMGMGQVELHEGRLMVGNFEVGAFYWDRGGVLYAVDGSLRQTRVLVGELGLERDWANAALDGAGDALGEMAQALAQLVTDPIRSLEGLEQLPSAVAALLASSPEYFEHYAALPRQEQIREAARLSTHLLMLYGSASGAATSLGAAGVRVPVLSLTAEGALAIEQVAVPAGASVAAVGAGAGAVYVIMAASQAPGGAGAGGGFKPFTEGNFRENLARLTGKMPKDAHAHHVFPQQFAREFKEAGIHIQDPRFGAWWEKSSHLRGAVEYNKQWLRFFRENPTATFEQVLEFGRQLAREYGFQLNY